MGEKEAEIMKNLTQLPHFYDYRNLMFPSLFMVLI